MSVFDDLVVNRHEYPVAERWQTDRDVSATAGFFEAVYHVGPPRG